jgi:hypothetical protein
MSRGESYAKTIPIDNTSRNELKKIGKKKQTVGSRLLAAGRKK